MADSSSMVRFQVVRKYHTFLHDRESDTPARHICAPYYYALRRDHYDLLVRLTDNLLETGNLMFTFLGPKTTKVEQLDPSWRDAMYTGIPDDDEAAEIMLPFLPINNEDERALSFVLPEALVVKHKCDFICTPEPEEAVPQ
jgi:hypothetical protein